MSMMPPDPDGRPEPPAAEAPGAEAAPAPAGRLQPSPAATPNESLPPMAPAGDRPPRRRRRRRRHRPPRGDATPANGAAALAAGTAPAQDPAAQPLAAEGALPATAEQPAPASLPAENVPRKRRRRRRRPRPKEAGETAATGTAAPASAATQPEEPRRDRPPRHRERRRGPREERPRDRENREGSSGPRAREQRDAGARGRHGPRDERGARPPKARRHGRDRDDFRKKPEPKLSRLESVVDRGFEDVADPAAEGATRRVDWTILKRSTVDQRAAQALSATYVLRRDGTETEFAQLSAARAAVNKTISHPEKLTLSKADHAAARGGKK